MDTTQTDADDVSETAVACTLSLVELSAQGLEWADLAALSLTSP